MNALESRTLTALHDSGYHVLSVFKDCLKSYHTRRTNSHLACIFVANLWFDVTSPDSGVVQATAV